MDRRRAKYIPQVGKAEVYDTCDATGESFHSGGRCQFVPRRLRMNIEHFVITRFCIRKLFADMAIDRENPRQDPLEADSLAARLRLLGFTASAAILGQTCRDFSWVLLVDRDLGARTRAQLEKRYGGRVRLILHDFDPAEDLLRADWLAKYFKAEPDLLITSYLDDDDLFSRNFVEVLQAACRHSVRGADAPAVRIFGLTQIWLWNLLYSRIRPLGTRSDWRRPGITVPACGFSLMCRYPEVPMSVTGLRHADAQSLVALDCPPAHASVAEFRERLAGCLPEVPGRRWKRPGFEALSDRAGPAVMGNHLWNHQFRRILEEQVNPKRVLGPETFPDHPIEWEAARSFIRESRLPKRALLKLRLGALGRRLPRFG